MQRPPEVDRGLSETQRWASYLVQGLPVGFWQVLRLVVSHGPLSHHLGVSRGLQDSRSYLGPHRAFPTHLQGSGGCATGDYS